MNDEWNNECELMNELMNNEWMNYYWYVWVLILERWREKGRGDVEGGCWWKWERDLVEL